MGTANAPTRPLPTKFPRVLPDLFAGRPFDHTKTMSNPQKSNGLQISVTGLLALVACVALNIWLFRVGILLGIIGLNITKHVFIAYLCQLIGVNKQRVAKTSGGPPSSPTTASGLPVQ